MTPELPVRPSRRARARTLAHRARLWALLDRRGVYWWLMVVGAFLAGPTIVTDVLSVFGLATPLTDTEQLTEAIGCLILGGAHLVRRVNRLERWSRSPSRRLQAAGRLAGRQIARDLEEYRRTGGRP